VQVFYELYGSGTPTVLLLPTWSIIHSRHWKMQIPYLARHCRVLTFDGRGNGRSDRPARPAAYDEREFAADALAVMDATATDAALLVSLSLGAQRALLLAAEHPDRVDAAVFIGPAYPGGGERLAGRLGFSWEDELDTDEGWAKYNKHYWLRDYRGFLEFFFSHVFTEPHSAKPIEDCVGWGLQTSGETLVTAQYGRLLAPEEARELAGRIRCPVLVIHGTGDAIVSETRGLALAEHTRGDAVLLEGSGHAPHVRARVKVNLLLRDFACRRVPTSAWTGARARGPRVL
jgi:pimeloyl-ACP methyl ester carboxylesterase